MATAMLVGEGDARDSGSDISMSQVPKQSLHAFVRPSVFNDFSSAIPMQSSEFIDSSLSVCSEKMRDGGLDSNENLSPRNGSPLRANELNPHAGWIFASNKPVAVRTMTDDSIIDFLEINGGEQLSLATEIDMEPDDASLCTEGETSDSVKAVSVLPMAEPLNLVDPYSSTLFEEVTVRGICESGKLLPHEESHIQEIELDLETEDQQFASNKSASALSMIDDDTTDLIINNGNNSLAAEIGTKPDDKKLCGEDVYYDSVQILAPNHFTKINVGEKEKDEVDFDYQHVDLNGGNNLEALEVSSLSAKRLVDIAETFPVDDPVMPVLSSTFGIDDNSKSESLMTNDHVKEDNALNMVEVKSSVSEEHRIEHQNCQIDEELEEHCKCDGLLVDNHVPSNVFDDKLVLEVQEVNYDNCICNGNFEVDERDKETQNASDIHHQSNCIIENQIIDGASEMLLVMPQPGKQLLESNTSSEAVPFEALNVLESFVAESPSEIKYLILQNDADILLNDGDRHIDISREVEDYASGINMLQNPDLCSTDQVEVQTTSATMDERHSEVCILEESQPFEDLRGLVRGFNSLPQFSSASVGKPPESIRPVGTDSGDFAHSCLVEVSMLEGSAEGVGPVIVDDHTYFDQSLDTKREKYYGPNLKIDGQANLEEADLGSDHISSFFLSDNLFTPFSSHFRRRDGGMEWDPSLSTEELLQLSCSVVGKEMGLEHVPFLVTNFDGRPVCGTTDNLCINFNMKGKEVDPVEPAELADSDNMHLADELETCCLTNFPFGKDGGSPITGYAAMTGEVEKDISISSSCSSGVDERQRKPFEGNDLFVVYQTESDSSTNYWLDRHDSLNSQDIGAECNDTEMPKGVAEGQSGKVSKLDTIEKYKMGYAAEETVATAKSDQEKASYTDETEGSEEDLFTGSVNSSVSDSEHHAGERSSCDGSSPLSSSQIEHSATSSAAAKQSAESCQFTASKSVDYDFNFRGASKLVDQFDECLAKESEEIGKDEVQPEQDKYSDSILTCKRPSFQECCGVWDWLRGFRG